MRTLASTPCSGLFIPSPSERAGGLEVSLCLAQTAQSYQIEADRHDNDRARNAAGYVELFGKRLRNIGRDRRIVRQQTTRNPAEQRSATPDHDRKPFNDGEEECAARDDDGDADRQAERQQNVVATATTLSRLITKLAMTTTRTARHKSSTASGVSSAS